MNCRHPANKAKLGIFFVTTAPAPTNAYEPISFPQTIVQLAPKDAPFPIRVNLYSSFLSINERGLKTFVKTALGPIKTSSSIFKPSYKETLF